MMASAGMSEDMLAAHDRITAQESRKSGPEKKQGE